jgi:RNA polymerase sigma-70 factor (ECF subfamily)
LNSKQPDLDARFLDLLKENRNRILKICRVYAWNREDQDDLYQEILCQIWRSLPTLINSSIANTWLYRVSINTAISFLRQRAARQKRVLAFDPAEIRGVIETNQPGRENDNAQLAALYEGISRLDSFEKALVTLFLEDLSYEQIADVLGIKVNHVGVLLHRAKKKLSVLTKEVPQ